MDFSNIPTGLNIPSQLPLDPKKVRLNEATLAYLGVSDNLAYTYYEQMEVVCMEEATRWVWREVGIGEANTGLIPVDFTYPINTPIIYGIDYSERVFNFFPLTTTGATGATGPAGSPGSVWRNGSGAPSNSLGINGDYYLNNTNGDVYFKASGIYSIVANIKGPTGNTGATGPSGPAVTVSVIAGSNNVLVTGTGVPISDPFIIDTFNYQDTTKTTSFILTDAHDKRTFYINNVASNITVTVPTGLVNNFYAIFYQEGTGNITFVEDGTNIRYPAALGPLIKGQHYWACIEKKENTEDFNLSGSIKA